MSLSLGGEFLLRSFRIFRGLCCSDVVRNGMACLCGFLGIIDMCRVPGAFLRVRSNLCRFHRIVRSSCVVGYLLLRPRRSLIRLV